MRYAICCLVVALAGMSSAAHAACYTVYAKDGKMIYRDQVSPVDLGRSVGDAVPERFGAGASMVFSTTETDCLPIAGLDGQAPPPASQAADIAAHANVLSSLAAHNSAPVGVGVSAGYGGGSAFSDGSYRGAQGPILTGPRGGQYYVNSGGNKTYVKR